MVSDTWQTTSGYQLKEKRAGRDEARLLYSRRILDVDDGIPVTRKSTPGGSKLSSNLACFGAVLARALPRD